MESSLKNIEFSQLLELIKNLPDEEKEKIMWVLRKEEAVKGSLRLDDMIFNQPN